MGVSARMNIGRVYEPDSEHAQSLDHKSYDFTCVKRITEDSQI